MNHKQIILENIFNRRSVRDFTDEKVSMDSLRILLKAAMSAPSGLNLQPWEFIVFDKEEILNFMVDLHEYSKMFRTATAGIVVCGNMDKTVSGYEELWIQDCSASVENILLSAEAIGLGAVWLGIYPVKERMIKLSNYFNLADNIVPFAVIALGYPAKNEQPKDKWNESKIHINRW